MSMYNVAECGRPNNKDQGQKQKLTKLRILLIYDHIERYEQIELKVNSHEPTPRHTTT